MCTVEDGSTVEVYTKAGGFLGTGIINKKSKITVRIIGSEHADVIMADTDAFYEKKILDAYNMRRMFYKDSDSYRLIFGEADLIPGLFANAFATKSKGNNCRSVSFIFLRSFSKRNLCCSQKGLQA